MKAVSDQMRVEGLSIMLAKQFQMKRGHYSANHPDVLRFSLLQADAFEQDAIEVIAFLESPAVLKKVSL